MCLEGVVEKVWKCQDLQERLYGMLFLSCAQIKLDGRSVLGNMRNEDCGAGDARKTLKEAFVVMCVDKDRWSKCAGKESERDQATNVGTRRIAG